MKQLDVTYKFKDYTWSDGTKGSVADFKLAYKIDCDKESGATTFEHLRPDPGRRSSAPALEYTVTWLPGSQYSLYFLAPIGQYNGSTRATRCWPTAASWPTSRRRNGRPCPRSPRSR